MRIDQVFAMAACAAISAQGLAQDAQLAVSQESQAPPTEWKAELEFLHRGSATLLDIDDALSVVTFPVVINGIETWALLDTGSGSTSVDVNLAKNAGLTVKKLETETKTTFSSLQNYRVLDAKIEVPAQFRIKTNITGKDFSNISKVLGKEIGLMLGMDILRNIVFVIDSKRKKILFVYSGAVTPRNAKLIRFAVDNEVLAGNIAGKPAVFKIDLGTNSNVLVLHRSWFRFFGKQELIQSGESYDAAGAKRPNEILSGIEIDVGPISLTTDVERIPFESEGVDALLGYPLFKGRVTIFDYAAGHITMVEQ